MDARLKASRSSRELNILSILESSAHCAYFAGPLSDKMVATGSEALLEPSLVTQKASADSSKHSKDVQKLKESSKAGRPEAKRGPNLKPAKANNASSAKRVQADQEATAKIADSEKPGSSRPAQPESAKGSNAAAEKNVGKLKTSEKKSAPSKTAKAAASLTNQGGSQTAGKKKSGSAKKSSKKAMQKPQEAGGATDEFTDAAAEASCWLQYASIYDSRMKCHNNICRLLDSPICFSLWSVQANCA